ncbi:MAG: hypothetical protein LUD72_12505 [Bacteroidales bacterium]|nr:hypothetical protein [Bacteroidales bacterium]
MDFTTLLRNTHVAVMTQYPSAFFYEAQCALVATDDGQIGSEVNPEATTMYWGMPGNKTVYANFDADGNPTLHCVNLPFLEDHAMCPYLPMSMKDAIDVLNTANFVVETPVVTLRFPLEVGNTEPLFAFTLNNLLVAEVGAYSGKVTVRKLLA